MPFTNIDNTDESSDQSLSTQPTLECSQDNKPKKVVVKSSCKGQAGFFKIDNLDPRDPPGAGATPGSCGVLA